MPWRWKQQASQKRRCLSTTLHGLIPLKLLSEILKTYRLEGSENNYLHTYIHTYVVRSSSKVS